jgi:prophage regulatory protein
MARTSAQSKSSPNKNKLPAELPAIGYVRISQLIPGILPFSVATLWRMVKKKTFPAPVKLSENITAWKVEDVRSWLDAKKVSDAPNPEGHQEPEGKAA